VIEDDKQKSTAQQHKLISRQDILSTTTKLTSLSNIFISDLRGTPVIRDPIDLHNILETSRKVSFLQSLSIYADSTNRQINQSVQVQIELYKLLGKKATLFCNPSPIDGQLFDFLRMNKFNIGVSFFFALYLLPVVSTLST
jgi:hypothetical protein